jgi:catechol 2,3-dioxygenase-like lactoylglutathione lyase family enzyme
LEAHETIFNHVGLCVTDLERARRFYEEALGFRFWFEFGDLPEDDAAQLLMLETPLQLRTVYLIRDGLVLELLDYHPDRMRPVRERSMAEPGLTHMSVTVGDLATAFERVERCGGTVLQETNTGPAVMVRDPDGQLIELLDPGWLDMRPPLPVTM